MRSGRRARSIPARGVRAAPLSRTLLFGVNISLPHVFAMTAAMLGLATLAATVIPARRASHANPIVALEDS